jgi:hypothetical protein
LGKSRRLRTSFCLAWLPACSLLAVLGCSSAKPRGPGEAESSRDGAGAPALKDVPRDRTIVVDCPDSGIGTGQCTCGCHERLRPEV